jgi:hypothetical protein
MDQNLRSSPTSCAFLPSQVPSRGVLDESPSDDDGGGGPFLSADVQPAVGLPNESNTLKVDRTSQHRSRLTDAVQHTWYARVRAHGEGMPFAEKRRAMDVPCRGMGSSSSVRALCCAPAMFAHALCTVLRAGVFAWCSPIAGIRGSRLQSAG